MDKTPPHLQVFVKFINFINESSVSGIMCDEFLETQMRSDGGDKEKTYNNICKLDKEPCTYESWKTITLE